MKLSNDIELGRVMMEPNGFRLTKAQCRTVFSGRARKITAQCLKCSNPHEETFVVVRTETGVEIGCQVFTAEDVKQVRRWYRVKTRRVTA